MTAPRATWPPQVAYPYGIAASTSLSPENPASSRGMLLRVMRLTLRACLRQQIPALVEAVVKHLQPLAAHAFLGDEARRHALERAAHFDGAAQVLGAEGLHAKSARGQALQQPVLGQLLEGQPDGDADVEYRQVDEHNALLPPDAFHLPVGRPVFHKIFRDATHPSRLVLPLTQRA